jgi:hypothetical protein
MTRRKKPTVYKSIAQMWAYLDDGKLNLKSGEIRQQIKIASRIVQNPKFLAKLLVMGASRAPTNSGPISRN